MILLGTIGFLVIATNLTLFFPRVLCTVGIIYCGVELSLIPQGDDLAAIEKVTIAMWTIFGIAGFVLGGTLDFLGTKLFLDKI
ncbi:MAG: hypothetical protein O2794_04395 [bacterium]|nr:hypothetical protein [bacterium]